MKDKRQIIRQGDVMLVPIENLPGTLTTVPAEEGRLIIAHGEVTGHHHSFAMYDQISLFREDGSGGGMFVMAYAPTKLEHQEHAALVVDPGAWEVRRQRTVTSAGVARMVAD